MQYYARMLAADGDAEETYDFEGPETLMDLTVDEIVGEFFKRIEDKVLKHHIDWEINSAMKNRERRVVTALGSLVPSQKAPPIPFLLMISDH